MVPSPLAFCSLLSPSQEPDFFLLTVLTLEVVFTVEHSSIQHSDQIRILRVCVVIKSLMTSHVCHLSHSKICANVE